MPYMITINGQGYRKRSKSGVPTIFLTWYFTLRHYHRLQLLLPGEDIRIVYLTGKEGNKKEDEDG